MGFLLLLRFSLHSSRSGRFCRNPLPSFKVIPVLNVASLGISVFPLQASLSACNRDMPLFHSSVQTAVWWHSQPHVEVLSEQSFHGDFQARLPPRVVSCLHKNGIVAYNSFAFIQRDLSRWLSAQVVCKNKVKLWQTLDYIKPDNNFIYSCNKENYVR